MTKDNNFEILLYLAAESCAQEEIDDFLSRDAGNYQITPELRKQAYKIIKQSKKKRLTAWQAVKYTLVACLIFMSLCFAACMCIPEVRNAIKEAFISWYDEYIEIGFKDENGSDTTPPYTDGPNAASPINAETPDPHISDDFPTTIEKKAYATYLPVGYSEKIKLDNSKYLMLDYELNGKKIFSLNQIPIDNYLVWIDSSNENITKEIINGFMAILTKENDSENNYTLIWQTDEYEFALNGTFNSKEEIIRIAEGIKTK